MKNIIPVILSFLFMLTSCTVQKGASTADTNQPEALKAQWILLNEDTGKPYEGMQEKPITLEFEASSNKQLMGYGGCNQYGGKYIIDGNTISFKGLYSTKMACPDMDIEYKYFSLLEDVNRYEVKGKELKLYKDQILLLRYKK